MADEISDVQPAMDGCILGESPLSLSELTLAANAISAVGLIPSDRDVDEPLEEVALLFGGNAPDVLEDLVGSEVLPAFDELEATAVLGFHPAVSSSF